MNNYAEFLRVTGTVLMAVIQLGAAGSLRAQTQSSIADVQVESVELSNIGTEGLEATVRLSATAKSSGSLRTIVFDQVTINGVRVRVPAVPGPIKLRTDEQIDVLRELRATLSYRELDSLEPLQRAVREGRAELHATVRAQVELNLFQKLALRAGGAWVAIGVDRQVPVNLPAGPLGRIAALGVLVAAEPVWIAGQSAQEWRRNRAALAEKVRGQLPGRLVSIETRYDLKSKDGETVAMRHWSSGFLLGHGGKCELVALAESVEPWSFDPPLAEALENGSLTVDESRLEILATPAMDASGTTRTFSLQRRELRILKELHGEENLISSTTKRRYHARFRDNDSNAVLFEVPAAQGPAPELAPGGGSPDWQPAAVVRFDLQDSKAEPRLWLTEARLEGGRYLIKDPVDSTAFGSPVWMEGGVVGLLQDEGSAAEITGILKKLR